MEKAMTSTKLFARLRAEMTAYIDTHNISYEPLIVSAKPLTPDEVIGNPEHDDYPLVEGRERMMEAVIHTAHGQAYTDMYGVWEGTVKEVCRLPLTNSFRRAVFTATLNALVRLDGKCDDTVHCKDEEPVDCAENLIDFIKKEKLSPPFTLIGYQPRMADVLAHQGELRIVDKDVKHIGEERCGTIVFAPKETGKALRGAGCAFVTGSTLVNGTLPLFLELPVPTVFYGVTIAGAAHVLGLKRFCPCGR